MAGTVVIGTLSDGTNSTSSTNPIRGSAKAWVNFQGGNGNTAGAINSAFNVSSVTANTTGVYTINFTTAMPSANYSMAVGGGRMTNGSSLDWAQQIQVTPTGLGGYTGYQAGSCQINTPGSGSANVNWTVVNVTFFA